MSVILILIFASLLMAGIFLAGFIWSVRSDQYEDTLTPSLRILTDETTVTTNPAAPLTKPNELKQ